MHEADKKQADILKKYIRNKPKPHNCETCQYSAKDSEGALRCLCLESPHWMGTVDASRVCSAWRLRGL